MTARNSSWLETSKEPLLRPEEREGHVNPPNTTAPEQGSTDVTRKNSHTREVQSAAPTEVELSMSQIVPIATDPANSCNIQQEIEEGQRGTNKIDYEVNNCILECQI